MSCQRRPYRLAAVGTQVSQARNCGRWLGALSLIGVGKVNTGNIITPWKDSSSLGCEGKNSSRISSANMDLRLLGIYMLVLAGWER